MDEYEQDVDYLYEAPKEEEEYIEIDIEKLAEDICSVYDNGVGANTIEKLMGNLAVQNIDLAKTIYEELVYWVSHDEKTKRKV